MHTPPLYLIQSFLAFCRSRNIVEAAESIGLSQPALTAHLSKLEDCFDHDVFIMRGRKKELSVFGQRLFNYLNAKLGSLDQDLRQIQFDFLKPTQAIIKIGARSEILNYFSDRIDFPGRIVFEDIDGAKAVEAFIQKDLDLAISNHLEKAQDLICKKAFTDQFVILCSKHYFKSNQSLDLIVIKKLMAKPFISYKGADPFLEKVLKHFNIQEISQPYRIISNWLTIVKMIQKGEGWAIAPKLYCENLENVIQFDLKKVMNTDTHFYFLYRKELRKVLWFQDFIEKLSIFSK